MANTILLKRSAVAGKVPLTSDVPLGSLALNTYDGKLFTKKSVSGVESIVEIGAGGGGSQLSGGTISGDYLNTSTGYFQVSTGTTAQRPATAGNGQIRYNSSVGCLEAVAQNSWQIIANDALDYGLITSAADTTFDYGSLV